MPDAQPSDIATPRILVGLGDMFDALSGYEVSDDIPDGSVITPRKALDAMTVDELVEYRVEVQNVEAEVRIALSRTNAEIRDRLAEVHPDWDVDEGGTRDIAGEELLLRARSSPVYIYDAFRVDQAVRSLTEAQRQTLFVRRVNNGYFEALVMRGGDRGRQLAEARSVWRSDLRIEGRWLKAGRHYYGSD